MHDGVGGELGNTGQQRLAGRAAGQGGGHERASPGYLPGFAGEAARAARRAGTGRRREQRICCRHFDHPPDLVWVLSVRISTMSDGWTEGSVQLVTERMVPPLLPFVAAQPLTDHHCHGVLRSGGDVEALLNEADGAAAGGGLAFDSLAGLAFRRWCPPLLDLPAHAPAEDYQARRDALGAAEVAPAVPRRVRSRGAVHGHRLRARRPAVPRRDGRARRRRRRSRSSGSSRSPSRWRRRGPALAGFVGRLPRRAGGAGRVARRPGCRRRGQVHRRLPGRARPRRAAASRRGGGRRGRALARRG